MIDHHTVSAALDKPKIFVFINGTFGRDLSALALSEDGHVVAGHVSSTEDWVRHDMGLTSDWKHDKYVAHYPNGYELVEVGDPDNHEGFQAALSARAKLRGDIDD